MKPRESFVVVGLVLLVPVLLIGQQSTYTYRGEPDDQLYAQITSQVHSRFGTNYEVVAFVLDSLFGTFEQEIDRRSEERLDPYGTLKGCVVFSASQTDDRDEENSIVGIFKNGQILWYSEPILQGYIDGILTTNDINNDGQVDIVMTWKITSDADYKNWNRNYLWILSWDGTTGRIINNWWNTPGKTSIQAEGGFEMFDMDGDGIMEFRGDDRTVDPNNPDEMILKPITYSWNGSVYGVFGKRVLETDFLPANRIDISVNCMVEKRENQLIFHYAWRSAPTSKQRLRAIYLADLPRNVLVSGPGQWEAGTPGLLDGVYWYVFDEFKTEMIGPGETKNGFTISYGGLPFIVRYYARGYVPEATGFGSDEERQIAKKNDVLTNSTQGYTIAPKDPPSPFVPLPFLDTLISYKHRAHDLGWIKNRGIVQSLDAKLENAKRQLQRNNTTAAKNILQAFLNEVEALWKEENQRRNPQGVQITSEAYALLKFNAEYLIAQLQR